MYANEIFTGWWYGKTEYMWHFCCHGNELWRHYDVIGQNNSDLKQFRKGFFKDYFLLFC